MPDELPISQSDTPIVLLSWQALSQPHVERSPRWYAIGGGATVVIAAYGIITGSWSFAVVILLCAVLYYLLRDHVPQVRTIAITDKGVFYEQRFTSWDNIAGYWILETPGYNELHFCMKNVRQPDIVIQTGRQNTEQLRVTIAEHVQEMTEKKESLIDTFIRIYKL